MSLSNQIDFRPCYTQHGYVFAVLVSGQHVASTAPVRPCIEGCWYDLGHLIGTLNKQHKAS